MKGIRISIAVQMVAVIIWLIVLHQTFSYYINYFLLGTAALILIAIQKKNTFLTTKKEKIVIALLALLFSAAIVMAEYKILHGVPIFLVMLLAGFTVMQHVLTVFYVYASSWVCREGKKGKQPAGVAFLFVFAAYIMVNLLHLFLSAYTGNLTVDSYTQIGESLAAVYTNHHPYWHTRILGAIVKWGSDTFGNINAGVAAYCVVQIVLMGLCFAFAAMTVYQAGGGKRSVMLLGAGYALMPYHIMYSCTVWKDVLFGGTMLLFTVSMYRILYGIGKKRTNAIIVCISGIGVSLLRNNGWLALFVSVLIWLVFFGKKRMKTTAILASVLMFAWIMKGPALDVQKVEPSNFRESLSIPIQQIARVVKDGGDVRPEHEELISKVIDIHQIPELYHSHISDPVKFAVDGEYIRENKLEYLKLWIEMGIENPVLYLCAWIDQTRGFWNNGYNYWIWSSGVQGNDFGISGPHGIESIHTLFNGYCNLLTDTQIFAPLRSIGLHVWLLVTLMAFNLLWNSREKVFLAIPTLMLIGTLFIATPVYCEFRYAYALFTVLPTYLVLSLRKNQPYI